MSDPNQAIPGPDPGACDHCGGWRKAGMVHDCERDALQAEVERLKIDGTPGIMHKVDQAFYDLTVKERDYERRRVDRLEQALREIARTWPNAKRSGRRPSLSAEEAQRCADAALHPNQPEKGKLHDFEGPYCRGCGIHRNFESVIMSCPA